MVRDIVVDPFHLFSEGAMSTLLDQWLAKKNHKLSFREKEELQHRMENMKKFIPAEFNRKLRGITAYSKYKAAEFEFLLKYVESLAMKGILPGEKYCHYLLLQAGYRLLSKSYNPSYNVTKARIYSNRYVDQVPEIYSKTMMTINTHDLRHFANDIDRMKCHAGQTSAGVFEAHLGLVKRLIRSPDHIVARI